MSGCDVEREAVHRAAVGEAHTDRADLARVGPVDADPHAGVVVEATDVGHAELGAGVRDDHALDRADVVGGAQRVRHVDDRIADQLAGAVVGDVAAALHRHQLGADRRRIDAAR